MKRKETSIPLPLEPKWTHTLEALAEGLRDRLPPGAPIYLVWGENPEEVWRSLKGTGLPLSLLLEIWERSLAEGYNLLAFSLVEGRLHLTGART